MNEIARILEQAQPELGWDDATWEREEASYRRTWGALRFFAFGP